MICLEVLIMLQAVPPPVPPPPPPGLSVAENIIILLLAGAIYGVYQFKKKDLKSKKEKVEKEKRRYTICAGVSKSRSKHSKLKEM